ncbi:MAG: threonylcarbamoyl-AMP synthase [Chitinophagaceae bacterium]|jgi:L-threonylcarbamoyladenylate synthase|nr:threonylcarbamoyl-AMP synthase [Chitinophagaceae bacterium]
METDIEKCLQVLRSGGIILYPTDTIWGIGCDATDDKAVERIFQLKRRPPQRSMIVLMVDERDVLKYTAAADLQVFDYLKKTGKPTTMIFEHAIGLADNLLAEDGSIGIRLVKDEFCRHLIKRFKKPIVSTSANISGQISPANFKDISNDIINGVDYAVHYRRDDLSASIPSSVVKWKNGKIEIIR